jgi:Na+/H+ antiporter NhaA
METPIPGVTMIMVSVDAEIMDQEAWPLYLARDLLISIAILSLISIKLNVDLNILRLLMRLVDFLRVVEDKVDN